LPRGAEFRRTLNGLGTSTKGRLEIPKKPLRAAIHKGRKVNRNVKLIWRRALVEGKKA